MDMKRKELIDAIEQAAKETGYAFHTGAPERMQGSLRIYPAAWLMPIKLTKTKGRNEGSIRYRGELCLLQLANDPDERETQWSEMEKAAFQIADILRKNNAVLSCEIIKCTPEESARTTHGAISLLTTFDAEMLFCLN